MKSPWPDPSCVTIESKRRGDRNERIYLTPSTLATWSPKKRRPSVTSVLKILGTATEPLIKWAVGLEREACILAAKGVFKAWRDRGVQESPDQFAAVCESVLGKARAHQKALSKAADIGTQVHAKIHWYLKMELGLEPGEMPELSQPASNAFSAWGEWWVQSGLKAVRMEQPVWHPGLDHAGTIDLVAECPKRGLGLVDFKSSKGIYDEHHIQVAAYKRMGSLFQPLEWAEILHLPKTPGEGFGPDRIVPLGSLYKRTMSEAKLLSAFDGALATYKALWWEDEAVAPSLEDALAASLAKSTEG